MPQCSAGIQRSAIALLVFVCSIVITLAACSYAKLEEFALANADSVEDYPLSDFEGEKPSSNILQYDYSIHGGRQAFSGVGGQFARVLVGPNDEFRFVEPVAISGIDNYIYIVDAGPKVVFIYDVIEKEMSVVGNITTHFAGIPGNIYVAPDYSFYLADPDGRRVLHFTQEGVLKNTFADTSNLSRPIDVFLDETSQELYVADGSFSHIVVFDQFGTALRTIGGRGSGAGGFRAITNITRGAAGIFVLDRLEMPIQVLSRTGQFQFAFGQTQQVYPTAIEVNFGQLVFVSDRSDNTIRIYRNKELIDKIGGGGAAPGRFRIITSLWIKDNLLYVVDSGNRRIQVFTIKQQHPGLFGTT